MNFTQFLCNISQRYRHGWRFLLGIILSGGVAIAVNVINVNFPFPSPSAKLTVTAQSLPEAAIHPLPETLMQWQPDDADMRDYFDQVQPTPLGYLIWSEFPVTVFYPEIEADLSPNQLHKQTQWQEAVQLAIADWSEFLPLQTIDNQENADIVILREAPPVERRVNPETGEIEFSFARNAETRYRFYLDEQQKVSHQMTIYLSPHQRFEATQNTANHELGHALGIWGHSNNLQDVLYPRQTANHHGITPADINTLKKIYQQPTQLGWPLSPN